MGPVNPHYPSWSTPPPTHTHSFVLSPLPERPWRTSLTGHLLTSCYGGITDGFRIGAVVGYPLKPSCRNLKSAYNHPDIVAVYLDREVLLGCLHEVQPASPQASFTSLQVSPFGVIPKKHSPATDCGPFLPRRQERQRCHLEGPLLSLLYLGGPCSDLGPIPG